jgi:hypothetical protein
VAEKNRTKAVGRLRFFVARAAYWHCLITATFTIDYYCKRRLLRRKNTDYLTFARYLSGLASRNIF